MKNLCLLILSCLIAINSMATGVVGVNSPQAGLNVFNASTGLIITNVFSPAYTGVPIISTYGSATNGITTTITVSNLVITIASSNPTNDAVTWSSQYGVPLIQTGSLAVTPLVLYTNVFSVGYGSVPTVVATGDNTNTIGVIGIDLIGKSSFRIKCDGTNNVSWMSIGRVISPGANTVTY